MQNNDVSESSKADTLRMTMWWLKENYEYSEGVSVPRQILYNNYNRFCSKCTISPISSATFGKIIRQQFPQITTRRLGTRGQSKYHYHGLSVKITSSDFDPAFSKLVESDKEVSCVSILHPKNRSELTPTIKISMSNEDFPEDDTKSDLKHFLVMYQTHSQQILDSIIQGSFEEVSKFLSSFWKGCPDNFRYLFNSPKLISCVIFLDIQVYLSVVRYVLPSMDHILPDLYLKDFVIFLCNISSVLTSEISNSNFQLKRTKLKYAVIFKQLCLNWLRASHMLQLILPLFKDMDIVNQILKDFENVDLDNSVAHIITVMPVNDRAQFAQHFRHNFEELENILEKEFSVDDVVSWCQQIYDQDWTRDFRQLFLGWSSFLSAFLSELFLDKSPSFAHVHLIFMWLQHLLYIQCTLVQLGQFTIRSNDLCEYETTSQFQVTTDNVLMEPDLDAMRFIPQWYNVDEVNNISEHQYRDHCNVRIEDVGSHNGFQGSIITDNVELLWSL